jgi:hypothetical protein
MTEREACARRVEAVLAGMRAVVGDGEWTRMAPGVEKALADAAVAVRAGPLRTEVMAPGAPPDGEARDADLAPVAVEEMIRAQGFREGVEAALAVAADEEQAYADHASLLDSAGNHHGATCDTHGAFACKRISERLRALAPSPSPGDPAEHNEKE